jgi:hypothetical protein
MSVEGNIELERLDNVLFVGRPGVRPGAGEDESLQALRDRSTAALTPVELGRSSVNTIEVVRGLNVGDCVVLTDMSSVGGLRAVESLGNSAVRNSVTRVA